jgi:dihydrofolate reductase
MAAYAIHGHAIVSDDDKIADAQSRMPEALRNKADWQRFQDALDRAAAVLLGRKGHFAHPDRHGRNRIVVSSAARGIERRADAWWWNPNEVPLAVALAEAAPRGGIIAVPGGQRVYDAFLKSGGFDEFHLVRAHGVTLGDGVFLFGDCAAGRTAEEVLTAHGHAPMPEQVLDRQARVVLTVWRGRSAVARAAV